MRLRLRPVFVLIAGVLLLLLARGDVLAPTPAVAQGPDLRSDGVTWIGPGAGPVFLPDELVVQLRPGVPPQAIEALNRSHGARIVRVGARSNLLRIKLPAGADLEAALTAYRARPEVAGAARAAVARLFSGPNDPYYPYQWHLDNATWGGIRWHSVWQRSDQPKGTGVRVAVIDTGVAWDNPYATDLQGQSFLILPGSDVYNNDDNPTDDHGHGTHVTGTLAQATNNGRGVAGVAPGVTIVPIKVLNASGEGTEVEVVEGIYLAIGATAPCNDLPGDPPARIINMSLGWPAGTTLDQLPGLDDALKCAKQQNVLVVAASGNDGAWEVSYPAAHPDVVAVGASGIDEYVTWYSNAGDALDLTAPGGEDCSGVNGFFCMLGPSGSSNPDKNNDGYIDGVLQQTFVGDPNRASSWGYYFWQGTSMASPHVAGVAALVLGLNPGLSAAQVRAILEQTAEDHGAPGWDNLYGWGIVDAYAAVQAVSASPNSPPSANNVSASTNEDTAVVIGLSGSDAETCELTFSIVSGPSKGSLSAITNSACSGSGPYADSATITYTPNANANGADSFTYKVSDGSLDSSPATVSVSIAAVNDAPVANNDSASTPAATPVTINVLANDTDVDGNPLSVTNLTQPANGTATLNADNTITYTPSTGFTGLDSFTYTANDGSANSNVATVTVNVTAAVSPCAAPTITAHSDTRPTAGGTVSFSWSPVSGATEYTVQRDRNGSWQTRQVSSATSFSGADGPNDPNWRVFVSKSNGTCLVPGPATVFDP